MPTRSQHAAATVTSRIATIQEADMRRMSPRRAQLLRGIPMFHSCTDRELAQIDALVDDIEVEAGEVLIHEGRLGQETFIIVTGEAAVSIGGTEVARLDRKS